MGDGVILVGELETMLKEWKFVLVDIKGKSGGLLLGWRFRQFHLINAWVVYSSLCVRLYSIELKLDFCFVNVYGPYVNREYFWNNLFCLECLSYNNFILRGDFNYSMGFSKVWGTKSKVDSLSDYFFRLMDGFGLVDLVPSIIPPTWTNRRVGCENICKRLDRMLISANLLDSNMHFRQWVGCGGIQTISLFFCMF